MQKRTLFVDNIKVFLIALVVLHHWAITYGAPGGWYYYDNEGLREIPGLILTLFVATNQSFFMGMFFFISALFVSTSFQRKGTGKFLRDRLIRLGIPTLIFGLIISPIVLFVLYKFDQGGEGNLLQFVQSGHWFGFGPMWFVIALFLFNISYLIYQQVFKSARILKISFPRNYQIILFLVVLSVITFLVRIDWPVGRSIALINFQLGHFPQYIALFILGIICSNNDWLEKITFLSSRPWMIGAQILIWIVFPVIFFVGGVDKTGPEPFMGGFTVQSLSFSFWDQFTGFALIIGIVGIFKKYFADQNSFFNTASRNAYAVYVFHTFFLVVLGVVISPIDLNPFLKFLISAPIILIINFVFVYSFLKWPLMRKVF